MGKIFSLSRSLKKKNKNKPVALLGSGPIGDDVYGTTTYRERSVIFSCDEATLSECMSVLPSVGWSDGQ